MIKSKKLISPENKYQNVSSETEIAVLNDPSKKRYFYASHKKDNKTGIINVYFFFVLVKIKYSSILIKNVEKINK